MYCNRVRDTKACLQAGNSAAKAIKMECTIYYKD